MLSGDKPLSSENLPFAGTLLRPEADFSNFPSPTSVRQKEGPAASGNSVISAEGPRFYPSLEQQSGVPQRLAQGWRGQKLKHVFLSRGIRFS